MTNRSCHTESRTPSPPATPEGKVNVTDPDSRNVKTPRGYMQGYNTQAVCNETGSSSQLEINTDSPISATSNR